MEDRNKAIEMINRLVAAEAECSKQFNQRKGGTTAKAAAEEAKAAGVLFKALIGEKPTLEELSRMTEV